MAGFSFKKAQGDSGKKSRMWTNVYQCNTLSDMGRPDSPLAFRASPEDRKIIEALTKWTGLATASVMRLALKRLHDEEATRRTKPKRAPLGELDAPSEALTQNAHRRGIKMATHSVSECAGKALVMSLAVDDNLPAHLGVELAASEEFQELVDAIEMTPNIFKGFALRKDEHDSLQKEGEQIRLLLGQTFRAGVIYGRLFGARKLLDEDDFWQP